MCRGEYPLAIAWPLTVVIVLFTITGCGSSAPPSAPTPLPMTPPTSALTMTFGENPVPFRTTGCSFSTPQGWYTSARIQETAGVAFTPATLTQKLDNNTVSFLNESFSSVFGACSGMAFTPGTILANGAVCGVVGVCSSTVYSTYQFSISGTDANGRTVSFDSPLLRLGSPPAGLSIGMSDVSSAFPAPG